MDCSGVFNSWETLAVNSWRCCVDLLCHIKSQDNNALQFAAVLDPAQIELILPAIGCGTEICVAVFPNLADSLPHILFSVNG